MQLTVKVPCPKCKTPFEQALSTMRPGSLVTCPSCGARIKFTGDDASAVARTIQKSIDDLTAAFKRASSR
jgi:uncharacterized Zn finger protein (UPF0148 family)